MGLYLKINRYGYHRDQYWDLFCSWFILTILLTILVVILNYSPMILYITLDDYDLGFRTLNSDLRLITDWADK